MKKRVPNLVHLVQSKYIKIISATVSHSTAYSYQSACCIWCWFWNASRQANAEQIVNPMMTIYLCSTENRFCWSKWNFNTWQYLADFGRLPCFVLSPLGSAWLKRNLLDYFTSIQSAMHFMKACHFRSNHSRKAVLNILTLAHPSRFASSAYFSCVHSFSVASCIFCNLIFFCRSLARSSALHVCWVSFWLNCLCSSVLPFL